MKRGIPILLIFVLCNFSLFAQTVEKTKVMTLGTFHFDFPNNDVQQIDNNDQIYVLDSKYQKEIDHIVDCLAAFKPTIIAIERRREKQPIVDSLYQEYLGGKYRLERSEVQQIGFKLGEKMKLDQLYTVDEWGKLYNSVNKFLNDSSKVAEFEHFYLNNPDKNKRYEAGKDIIKNKGILAELIRLNQPEHIQKTLGNYLIGHFKYESDNNKYFGADFETGRWFNRNLRIFRNIQQINTKENDRILIIFGAGPLNLLNIFFKASPEYTLISPLKFLNGRQ